MESGSQLCARCHHIPSGLLIPSEVIILVMLSVAGSHKGWLFHAGNEKNGLMALQLLKFWLDGRLWSFLVRTTQCINQ